MDDFSDFPNIEDIEPASEAELRAFEREQLRGPQGLPGIDGKPGEKGEPGQDGRDGVDGKDGVGVKAFSFDSKNRLYVRYTNGEEVNFGVIHGQDGKPGRDGRQGKDGDRGEDGTGIADVSIEADELIITFTNGKSKNLGRVIGPQGKPGPPGPKGEQGKQGDDGRGILATQIDNRGHLIITFTDGTMMDAGRARGADGKRGRKGERGAPGIGGGGCPSDGGGTGDGDKFRQVSLTISTNGETNFTLPQAFKAGGKAMVNISGVEYYKRSDNLFFTISGTSLTWTYPLYALKTRNTMDVFYEIN